MGIEALSQIAGILSCLFALLGLVGIGITIKKVNKLNSKSNINVFGNVAGNINASNQVLENLENTNGTK